jgi:hypothetical protein
VTKRKGISEDVRDRIHVLQGLMVVAMGMSGKPIFSGVPKHVKAKRRSLNERQKASRKANRR